MKILKYGLILILSVTLWGCGKGNPAAPVTIDPVTKQHPANWANPINHGAKTGLGAKASASSGGGMNNCRTCHGSDFSGGISKVSCFNNANCHGVNVFSPHAKKPWWISNAVRGTHTSADPGNATACAVCHTNGLLSPIKPTTFNSGAQPGCFNNTLCHDQNVIAHTLPFSGSAHSNTTGSLSAGTRPFNCSCHDATTAATPSNTYPAVTGPPLCAGCHHDANFDSSHFLTQTPNCLDCHITASGRPNGVPNNYPNRAHAHAKHLDVRAPSIGCDPCHFQTGGGVGAANHGPSGKSIKPAVLAFNPIYNAQTPLSGLSTGAVYAGATITNIPTGIAGASIRDSAGDGTCYNVSCHGGQPGLTWAPNFTGLICTDCHAVKSCNIPINQAACPSTPVSAQYNGMYSGNVKPTSFTLGVPDYDNLHVYHLYFQNFQAVTCQSCHDMTLQGPNYHYANVGRQTAIPRGYAAPTIGGNIFVYTPATGRCNTSCHGNSGTVAHPNWF